MNTYLLLWNPKNWDWTTLTQDINQTISTGTCSRTWSCGRTKVIKESDRIFLLRVGKEPKGIVAAGFAASKPFYEQHWGDENKNTLYIDINFDIILNPEEEPILTVSNLRSQNLEKQNWMPMGSGISVKPELVDKLEKVWSDFLANREFTPGILEPINNNPPETYIEGTPNEVLVNIYERNKMARKKCLEHFGYSCFVCDFNFEKTYGTIGKEFIHVHHLKQVSDIKETYQIDPIRDLRPVCPNCHAIIHRYKTPLTIDEIKMLIKNNSSNQ